MISLEPYVGAVVCWVYDEPHSKLKGQVTAAVVVRIVSASEGRVDLHAFRLDCHSTILVRDARYDGLIKDNGTWHWPRM